MFIQSLAKMSLRALSGEVQGQVFRVDGDLVVGRSTTATLFVPDRRISREHSRFFLENGRLFVEDLNSHNGTYVNGQRIARAELFHGDLVRLGTSQFSVEAAQTHDSSVIQVTSDTRPLNPRMVQTVQPISASNLGSLVVTEYFSSIGVSDTDRFHSAEKVDSLLQKTRNFAILHEVSKALQQYSDLRRTLPGLMDLILQVVRGDRVAVVLLDEHRVLVPRAVRFRDTSLNGLEGQAVTMSKTVTEFVMKEKVAIITADASADERFASSESIVLHNIRSLLVVPILVANRMLGLMEVENNRSINGFDENDLHLMSIVASMMGVAFENLEMNQARERAIAQLQQAQEQLLATQERLVVSERMGLLGRLASGITHEVKNHLSPFMLADMIARKYPDDEEIQESAELMLEAQQRILGLVDEIRSFASGAQTSCNIAPHDICAVIEGVLRFLKCDRVVKQADIHLVPVERPLVFMDANRIRQVLINLIRNASEALPNRGGRIDIRVSTRHDQVVVAVQDNGRGIPAELAPRVFEPFFSTKGEKGLGLGLDISRQITIAHGGTLTFDSIEGAGTTFRMILPLLPDPVGDQPFDDMKTDPHRPGFLPLAGLPVDP